MSGPSSGDRDRLAAWAADEERRRLDDEAKVRHATFMDPQDAQLPDARLPGWVGRILSRIRRAFGR